MEVVLAAAVCYGRVLQKFLFCLGFFFSTVCGDFLSLFVGLGFFFVFDVVMFMVFIYVVVYFKPVLVIPCNSP